MTLLNELKDRREAVANKLEDAFLLTEVLRAELDDFDTAIAALEPAQPTDDFGQAFDYTEQDGTRSQQELEDFTA